MINSIGLPNKGLDGFLDETCRGSPSSGAADRLGDGDQPRGVRRAGRSGRRAGRVAAIELNVSCPNVHSGLIVGEQPAETEALLEALRPLTAKPLIVKLTPNVADPAAVAAAAEQGGADAVSLINTLKASALDPASGAPGSEAGGGGLSGPAVRAGGAAPGAGGLRRRRYPGSRHGRDRDGADARRIPRRRGHLVAVGTENFRDPAGRLKGRRRARVGPLRSACGGRYSTSSRG